MKFKLALLLIVTVLGGCASPARVDQMSLSTQEVLKYKSNTPLQNNIRLKSVTGGQGTNPLWTSEIGDDEFKQALINSLKSARFLASTGAARYALDAKMISVKQPLFGVSFTVTSTIQYTLVRISDGKQLFSQTISAPYTAKFSDSFYAVKRLKLANEGSAKQNITQLISNLYKLDISPHEVSVTQ